MLEIALTLDSEVQIVKSKIIATAAILAALGLLHPHPALSQPATDGGTKPGFWQPQAQVDNTRNITLRLLNETGLNLEYGQSGANLSSLPVGASKNLIVRISNRTGDIANIPINATTGTTTLKYDYNVDSQKNIVRFPSPDRTAAPGKIGQFILMKKGEFTLSKTAAHQPGFS